MDEVDRFHSVVLDLQTAAADYEDLGLIRLSSRELKTKLVERAVAIRDGLILARLQASREDAAVIHDDFGDMVDRVMQRPSNEQELVDLREYIESSSDKVKDLERRTQEIHDFCDRARHRSF